MMPMTDRSAMSLSASTADRDRALLEAAARAVGWRMVSYSERRSTGVIDGGMAVVVAEGRTFGWSPLHNDGDALRLAVKLRLSVMFDDRGNVQVSAAEADSLGSDPAAAVRRCVVRAAAALGEK